MTADAPDVSAWQSVQVAERVEGGHRNAVWAGSADGRRVAIRRSRRSDASLMWELDLIGRLGHACFLVPSVIPTIDGAAHHDGLVVQEWIDGREPESETDWRLVADELGRLHRLFADHPQRPDCRAVTELDQHATSVDADLAALPPDVADVILGVFVEFSADPVSLIHGDPGASNIRIAPDGRVGLLDWDESRVDVTLHDLSNLGVQVLDDLTHRRAQRLSDAWEGANAWVAEPAYARRRLTALHRASR